MSCAWTWALPLPKLNKDEIIQSWGYRVRSPCFGQEDVNHSDAYYSIGFMAKKQTPILFYLLIETKSYSLIKLFSLSCLVIDYLIQVSHVGSLCSQWEDMNI